MINLKATSLSALSALMPFRLNRNSRPSLYLRNLLLLFAGLLFIPIGHAAVVIHKVTLSCDTPLATTGDYRLRWQGDEAHARYRLLESDTPLFNESRVVYQGTDLSTVIRNRPNGHYYYRVVELHDNTPLTASNTIKVTVHYQPQYRVWWLFPIGAAILLALLLWFLWRKRKHRSGES